MKQPELSNFLEIPDVELANQVDMKYYTFVKLDEIRGYVFKRRARG